VSDEWTTVKLKDVTLDIKSQSPPASREFTYVDISSIDNDRCEISEPKQLHGKQAPSRARRPIQEGDVVFSNVRTYLRNVAQVPDLAAPAIASTGFTVLRPTKDLDSRFLYHLARSDFFISRVTPEQTGTHYPATSDRVVRDQEISIPSVSEQVELAQLLDDVEDHRRSARSHVQRAGRVVGALRLAVAGAAVTGRLTEDWREGRELDGGEALVIAARERRELTQDRLFREPSWNPHFDEPDVPESWSLAPLGLLVVDVKYGTAVKSDYGIKGTAVLRIPNVSSGRLDLTDLKYAKLAKRDATDLTLEVGDLLMIRSNGSPHLVGRCVVVDASAEGLAYAGYLIRIRVDEGALDSGYAALMLASPIVRRQIEMQLRSTSGVHNINTDELRSLVVTVPPFEEQREIVTRASAMLKLAHELSDRIERASRAVERSGQAMLAKAFRGELLT
jgi:type I restriction enzyme S subunit